MNAATELTVDDLTDDELEYFEQQVEARKKKKTTAILLWVFLGPFGGHRFYFGRYFTGLIQLFTLGGFFVWTVVDNFLIPGWVKQDEEMVKWQVLEEIAEDRRDAGTD